MLRKLFIAILLTSGLHAIGQSNMLDSTVQVTLDWNVGEKQNYKVITERAKLNGIDTISNERTTYEVEVSVLNKSDTSYIIQWISGNIETNNTNPSLQNLIHVSKVKDVIIKTDEFGAFLELVNWKEIQDHLQVVINTLKTDFKDSPEGKIISSQIENVRASKETLQSSVTKDILQFLFFHGRNYKLGEVITEQLKVPHIPGGEFMDAELTFLLEEINEDGNDFKLRASQKVNQEQLTNATYNYLRTIAKNMHFDPPKKKDLNGLSNDTLILSRIFQTGWVHFCTQTTILSADGISNVENRIIEIKGKG